LISSQSILDRVKVPGGQKAIRYAAVSIVAILVSQVTLLVCYGIFKTDETTAQLVSFVTSMIPSYYLNRMWVWGKGGKSLFLKEVAPFWVIGVAQLLISLAFVPWAQNFVDDATPSHSLRTAGFLFNNLFIYGVMWVGKFMLFNKVLFKQRPAAE
jgi:putative flippase GtrA